MNPLPSWSDLVSKGWKALSNIPSLTYNAFVQQFSQVRDGAVHERQRNDAYGQQIANLKKRAMTILNSTNKANALKAIAQVEVRHRASKNMLDTVNNAWRRLVAETKGWLKSNPTLVAPKGLNGLDSPIVIVPVVVVGLMFLAKAFVDHARLQNDRIKTQIDERARVVDAMMRGQITVQQGSQILNDLQIEDTNRDPLGITNTVQAMLPLALAVAAIVIVPSLLRKSN
jgi:hypothetical protein